MPQSFWEFWDNNETIQGEYPHYGKLGEGRWQEAVRHYDGEIDKAYQILVDAVPGADKWVDPEDKRNLLPNLVLTLEECEVSENRGKPLGIRFEAEQITLHLPTLEELEEFLYQKSPRGARVVFWNSYSGDSGSEHMTRPHERLVSLVRRVMDYAGLEPDCTWSACALCVIRPGSLEVYAFPHGWVSMVERVHIKLEKMTAREKATKELPHELKAFVDLLGWEPVNNALQALKP